VTERSLHTLPEQRLSAVKALCVDLEKHLHGVSRPLGHVRRWNPAIEPGRDSGMTQVIRRCGQRRCKQLWRKYFGACPPPRLVDRVPRQLLAVALASKKQAIRSGAELIDVLVEQRGQLRWAGNGSAFPHRSKTVERWVTQDRPPYLRHRHAIAALLGKRESYLWPDALPPDRAAPGGSI